MNQIIFSLNWYWQNGCSGFSSPKLGGSILGSSLNPIYELFFRKFNQYEPTLPKESKAPAVFQCVPVRDRIAEVSARRELQALCCLSRDLNNAFSETLAVKSLPKLESYSALLMAIPDAEKPAELQGISCTLEILPKIESYLRARDTLILWQEAAKCIGLEDGPNFDQLHTVSEFTAKASEFTKWIDANQEAVLGISQIAICKRQLTTIPVEIGRFTGLISLNLDHNQIRKIEGLDKLHKLEQLWIAYNEISKIEGLEELHNLQMIWMGYNKISKIEGLDNLQKLEQLWLRGNRISRIEGLDQLQNLKQLLIAENQVQDVEKPDLPKQIEELGLEGNKIGKDVKGLFSLRGLESLANIHLHANQVCESDEIKQQIREHFLNTPIQVNFELVQ